MRAFPVRVQIASRASSSDANSPSFQCEHPFEVYLVKSHNDTLHQLRMSIASISHILLPRNASIP